MKMKSLIYKVVGIANCLALMLVVQSANSACWFYFHQPEFPEEAKKYKKVQ